MNKRKIREMSKQKICFSSAISEKCQDDSPKTVSSNLMKLKKHKTASVASTAARHETTSTTSPFKPLSTNNVNILNVEKYHCNVASIKEHSSNQPIPVRSALLTPGGHIRRNDVNKENAFDNRHDENIGVHNLSSDTLSMSGLLSSSKVQGSSTKTSLEEDHVHAIPVALNDPAANHTIGTKKNSLTQNSDITPTNSPTLNRKRTRSMDRTPSNCATPPTATNALDVYYNSKHRLTPSPRSQSNSSTPDTPRPKNNNLEVLFNRTHRLTPSPNRSKDHTGESINPTPVASLHNGLHSTHSTNFLGPSNSNAMRHLESNLRSPKLLTQSNSQFSSVSDLREFAIKSSQSVISWPSQKLRTPSVKQFTIKNIGGRKLTMKIEVIGPGFLVSVSK